MVCDRCIMVVKNELEKLGYMANHIVLGEATINEVLNDQEKAIIENNLKEFGFELIDDKNSSLIEKVKNLIIDLVHNHDNELKINLSEYLESNIHKDYTYLSNLFSESQGITIEKYYIRQKIERVKELIVYDELTLSEISFNLGYSSVAYLSSQFKKITGLTPGHFKKIKSIKRKSLDEL
ncbi:MAG TPA: AraC family transcriptional regulator [Ignavibacteria bacterium]|nr:AraC family transcriptional regulator [Ignavibacteria bacterium]HQY52726.1 AraC family transcriptional regulator [Ignavibacteria bacterium]